MRKIKTEIIGLITDLILLWGICALIPVVELLESVDRCKTLKILQMKYYETNTSK